MSLLDGFDHLVIKGSQQPLFLQFPNQALTGSLVLGAVGVSRREDLFNGGVKGVVDHDSFSCFVIWKLRILYDGHIGPNPGSLFHFLQAPLGVVKTTVLAAPASSLAVGTLGVALNLFVEGVPQEAVHLVSLLF